MEIIGETNELYIRPYTEADLDALYEVYAGQDPRFITPMSTDKEVELEKLKSYIFYVYGFYGFGLWAVCLKETDEMVGICGLSLESIDQEPQLELGYVIKKSCQGKGYAKACIPLVVDYGASLEMPKVLVRIHKGNTPSLQLIQKLGFKYAKDCIHQDAPHVMYEYVYDTTEEAGDGTGI